MVPRLRRAVVDAMSHGTFRRSRGEAGASVRTDQTVAADEPRQRCRYRHRLLRPLMSAGVRRCARRAPPARPSKGCPAWRAWWSGVHDERVLSSGQAPQPPQPQRVREASPHRDRPATTRSTSRATPDRDETRAHTRPRAAASGIEAERSARQPRQVGHRRAGVYVAGMLVLDRKGELAAATAVARQDAVDVCAGLPGSGLVYGVTRAVPRETKRARGDV
jgi:hypothetical protein